MTSPILVRAGLPLTGGTLVEYAKARGLPVLMSANAFAKRAPRDHPEGRRFEGFKQNLSALDGWARSELRRTWTKQNQGVSLATFTVAAASLSKFHRICRGRANPANSPRMRPSIGRED